MALLGARAAGLNSLWLWMERLPRPADPSQMFADQRAEFAATLGNEEDMRNFGASRFVGDMHPVLSSDGDGSIEFSARSSIGSKSEIRKSAGACSTA